MYHIFQHGCFFRMFQYLLLKNSEHDFYLNSIPCNICQHFVSESKILRRNTKMFQPVTNSRPLTQKLRYLLTLRHSIWVS